MTTTLPTASHTAHVRRPWCITLALALIFLGAILNTLYLFNHCPIDLSEDESHYWEWSRHLDYGYYSKPPGIAWVIAAAVKTGRALHLTGDNSGAALMPIIRMPAVLFGLLSGLLSLALARRIFRDDRAGLAAIVLAGAVPMFAVGSLLITIDSPMYLCWAATVYCLWRYVESSGQWSVPSGQEKPSVSPVTTDHWPLTTSLRWLYAAALACALGMLFKPVLIAIPVCVLIGMKFDPTIRRAFRTKHSLAALFIVLLSQLPVLIWNANHNWVTFRHILTQGGMGAQAGESKSYWYSPFARLGEYLGGQAGGMGGIMFVLLVIAILLAIKKRRIAAQHSALSTQDSALPYTFLLAFTLPLWLFYLVMNLWKRTEVNWPAASYFTGMILLAGIFTEGWNALDAKIRRPWRVWGTIAIAWGFLMTAAAMNFHRAYPYIAEKLAPKLGTEAYFKSWLHPTKWDQPTVRLRGLQDRAAIVERAREELRAETGHDPLLVTARYDTSSSLSFYLPNHPFVFSLMSSVGGRQSQYDLWPGLNEQKPDITLVHAGQNALIIGNFDDWAVTDVLQKSFQRLDPPRTVFIQFNGIQLKTVTLRNAYNFLGVPKTTGTGSF